MALLPTSLEGATDRSFYFQLQPMLPMSQGLQQLTRPHGNVATQPQNLELRAHLPIAQAKTF